MRVLCPVSRRMPQAILVVSFCLSYVATASFSSSSSVKCNRCLCMCLRQSLLRRDGRSGLPGFAFSTTGWSVGVYPQTDIHTRQSSRGGVHWQNDCRHTGHCVLLVALSVRNNTTKETKTTKRQHTPAIVVVVARHNSTRL